MKTVIRTSSREYVVDMSLKETDEKYTESFDRMRCKGLFGEDIIIIKSKVESYT